MRVKSEGMPLYYDVCGEGQDVVLLHPFPFSHAYWDGVAARLEEKYRFILPDLRGHGLSGVGGECATMSDHVHDVLRICEDAGVKRAVFGGCSIGGYICMELWRQAPERVRALILSDTRAEADAPEIAEQRLAKAEAVEQAGVSDEVDAMAPKLFGESTRSNHPELVQKARAIMLRTSGGGMAATLRGLAARPDSVETLSTITAPTLVFGGDEDMLTPRSALEVIASGVKHSTLAQIPRAGHLAAYENPEETARVMREFLDGLPY